MILSFFWFKIGGLFCRLLSWASNNQVSFWSLANKITCKKGIEDINRYLTRKNCRFMLIYCGECPACVLYLLSNKLLIKPLQTWEFALFSDAIAPPQKVKLSWWITNEKYFPAWSVWADIDVHKLWCLLASELTCIRPCSLSSCGAISSGQHCRSDLCLTRFLAIW